MLTEIYCIISVFFIGDAVRTNRWECLYPGFSVSFLSSAGICCRLGQRDSKAEVKKLTLRCCRLTQKEPHWSYSPPKRGAKAEEMSVLWWFFFRKMRLSWSWTCRSLAVSLWTQSRSVVTESQRVNSIISSSHVECTQANFIYYLNVI